MSLVMLACILFPLALCLLGLWRRLDHIMQWLFICAPVPALTLGFSNSFQGPYFYPNLLSGAIFGVDKLGRAFLILTSAIWLVIGIYSRAYFADRTQSRRFRMYFLLTLFGNLGVTLALDVITFYVFFSIMTFAGYGLITHYRSERGFVAGRFYLSFAFFGEMLIFSAMLLAVNATGSSEFAVMSHDLKSSTIAGWITALFFVGYGIKVGLVPVHAWLPRAYYTAPLPAVAALSGTMSKAGVLGWLRHFPLGIANSDLWSNIILFGGILTALYGALVGLAQTRARTALAFSSLSQMGYLGIIVAVTLEGQANYSMALTAAIAYSLHHGFTKAAMFLAVDLLAAKTSHPFQRWIVLAAILAACLALIGFPYSSGFVAKSLLKKIGSEQGMWQTIASFTLLIGSSATALLMLRFFVLCLRIPSDDSARSLSSWIAWLLVFLLGVNGGWLIPRTLQFLGYPAASPISFEKFLTEFMPIVILSAMATWAMRRSLFRDSSMTPRPLDAIIFRSQKTFGEELPKLIKEISLAVGQSIQKFIASLNLAERSERLIKLAAALNTSWKLGTGLFLSAWIAFWLLFALEKL